MPIPESRCRLLLACLIIASTLIRLFFAWGWLGFLTGDDVEVLETAFSVTRGLDYQPYEIRNLFLPMVLVAPVVGAAESLGADSAGFLVRWAHLPFVLLASLGLWLVFRLSRLWQVGSVGALLAATIYALHPLFQLYGSSTLPRVASTTALLGAAVVLSGPGREQWRGIAAGALAAVAFSCRYSEGVFLLPLLALAFLSTADRRRGATKALATLLAFVATGLLTVGLMDWLSWGQPFASLKAFATYTLLEKRASTLEIEQPLWWYLRRLPRWLPLPLLPLLFFVPRRRLVNFGWLFVLIPLLVLSLIHHKDQRYLQAVLPFVCLLAAAGATHLWQRGWHKSVTAVLILMLAFGAREGIRGQYRKSIPAVRAAEELAAKSSQGSLALSMAWAWGDRLFLGNDVEVVALTPPVSVEQLEAVVGDVDSVGLLAADLTAEPELEAVLNRAQLIDVERYGFGRSREVLLFSQPSRRLTRTPSTTESDG